MPLPPRPAVPTRAARPALGLALGAGALLLGISLWNAAGVSAALDSLLLAEGLGLGGAARAAIADQLPPTDETLGQAAAEDARIHWLAVVDHHDVPRAVSPAAPDPLPEAPPPGTLIHSDGDTLLTVPLGPPDGPREGGPREGGPRHERPALLLVAYTPQTSGALLARAWQAVGVSALGAVLLGLGAVWLGRLLTRAEANAQALAAAEHLAQLGEMSAVIAHQLRNPLAALKGHAQLLQRQAPEALRPRADRVVSEAARLETRLEGLLRYAQTDALNLQKTPLEPLLRAAAEEVGEGRVQIDAAVAQWTVDADRLGEVLANLIQNAVQAGEGPVEVAAQAVDRALVLTVADRGPGIPEENMPHLFEPFYTTRAQGTGLGLAIAARVVRQHRGTIQAGNRPGGGAIFTLTLPEP